MKLRHSIGVTLLTGLLCTSCDSSQVKKTMAEVSLWLKPTSPGVESAPSGQPSPNGTDQEFASMAARNAKANAEILHEMFVVVSMREPRDRSEFGNWADTLNQGASLEGVYNGLTHSGDYRKLEAIHTGATPEAVRVFGEELANLELELPTMTEFDGNSASPLPILGSVDPVSDSHEMKNAPSANGLIAATPSPKPDPKVLSDRYTKQFIGASIYTLKRVLGDEALKVVASKIQLREKLALWYSKWVSRMAQRNVDFGVALRNKPDEAFHFKWVMESADDRVKWEVLNRIHRVLNEANKTKQ